MRSMFEILTEIGFNFFIVYLSLWVEYYYYIDYKINCTLIILSIKFKKNNCYIVILTTLFRILILNQILVIFYGYTNGISKFWIFLFIIYWKYLIPWIYFKVYFEINIKRI